MSLTRRISLELLAAAAFVAGSAILGGVGGVVWEHFASRLPLAPQFDFTPAIDHRVFGQQVFFADVMIGAAVVVLLLVSLLIRWSPVTRALSTGPGAMLGLAGGGLLGSQLAAAIGHNQRLGSFLVEYNRLIPADLTPASKLFYLHAFEFRLHAVAMIVIWPLIVTIVHGIRCYARNPEPLQLVSAPAAAGTR